MPTKIRRVPKIHRSDDEAARAVHLSYFLHIGGPDGLVLAHGTPAWVADFHIRYGKPAYRKQAWADVRSTVKGKMPPVVFKVLDSHFTTGSGERFLAAFTGEELERMLKAVRKGRGYDTEKEY